MPCLILFRHGKSAWPQGLSDHERPLAPRGKLAVPLMARWLAAQVGTIDLALISSATRTRQTFDCMESLLSVRAQRIEPRIYEAQPERLVNVLRALDDHPEVVLMVGHNPGMHALALGLSGAGDDNPDALARLQRRYPTSGVAILDIAGDWSGLVPGAARLAAFMTPAQLGGVDED